MSRFLVPILLLVACTPEADDAESPPALAEEVALDALLDHLAVLEGIAVANDGNRSDQTSGYDESVVYVQSTLESAGLSVVIDEFVVPHWRVVSADLTADADPLFEVARYSGPGTVTAEVTAVNVMLPPGAVDSSASGCESGDFAAFPTGHIALIQRGACAFGVKVAHATAAGAVGVVIFNEGQTGRQGVASVYLDQFDHASVPVVSVSFNTGRTWALSETPVSISLTVETEVFDTYGANVIAELVGNHPDNVLLVGAHLDSVPEGPGINDNGSGTALVLESAIQMSAMPTPERTVRFAFWAAEEIGLVGSWEYSHDAITREVNSERMDPVQAYLNFDMLASGNGLAFVGDGDGSDLDVIGANPGAAVIEAHILDYMSERGVTTYPEALLIPSDSYWFAGMGIPTGHIFSGATAEDGVDDYDPCYHQACDDIAHLDTELYEDLAKAAAYVIGELAYSTAELGHSRNDRSLQNLPSPQGGHDNVAWDR